MSENANEKHNMIDGDYINIQQLDDVESVESNNLPQTIYYGLAYGLVVNVL